MEAALGSSHLDKAALAGLPRAGPCRPPPPPGRAAPTPRRWPSPRAGGARRRCSSRDPAGRRTEEHTRPHRVKPCTSSSYAVPKPPAPLVPVTPHRHEVLTARRHDTPIPTPHAGHTSPNATKIHQKNQQYVLERPRRKSFRHPLTYSNKTQVRRGKTTQPEPYSTPPPKKKLSHLFRHARTRSPPRHFDRSRAEPREAEKSLRQRPRDFSALRCALRSK